jgi:hypothetical protein
LHKNHCTPQAARSGSAEDPTTWTDLSETFR